MTNGTALRALLGGLVDYAGLFPPAALPMPDAVARYARYASGPHRTMLGRFVLPVARLDEFAVAADHVLPRGADGVSPAGPWRLSALAGPTDGETLVAFNPWEEGRALVDTVEAKAESAAAVSSIAAALGARFTVYVEVPVRDDPAPLLRAVRDAGLRAKIRTGGVTADAFPAPAEVLRFLVACAELDVPFKATAGLHHPLRGEYPLTYAKESATGTMYGFLNVFLASMLLRKGIPTAEVAPLLEERDARAITATDDGITWRGRRVTLHEVASARATFAGSFGSCSFEEPVQDLTSLQLI
ncbi:MAG: hypothetical protein KJZ74_04885 [Gemmatimonadales bacterium]|nr:hypothetical protein [Gemmatimonadales bacterium]